VNRFPTGNPPVTIVLSSLFNWVVVALPWSPRLRRRRPSSPGKLIERTGACAVARDYKFER
jgi:hypothetical protein